MTPRSFLAAAVVGAALLVVACSGSADTGIDADAIEVTASIASAVEYLQGHEQEISPLNAPIIDYLHRNHPDAVPAPSLDRLRLAAGDPASDEAIYVRLVEPDVPMTAERLNAEDDEVNVITAPALYCDRFDPPADFDSTLDTATGAGEYELTHAALADQWMLELGCTTETQVEDRRRTQADGLVDLVASAGADTDLGIEAVAMLLYTGHAGRVSERWIEAIVAAQHADGGWAKVPGDSDTSDHTTVLALWALLEFGNPDAERVDWVATRR